MHHIWDDHATGRPGLKCRLQVRENAFGVPDPKDRLVHVALQSGDQPGARSSLPDPGAVQAQICRSGVGAKIGAVPEKAASWWLNPKLSVRESPIAGRGLFAIAHIERSEGCCHLAGELMTDERFVLYIADRARYSALAVNERLHFGAVRQRSHDEGQPLLRPQLVARGPLTVVARRPIAAGDEATIDYALLTVEPTWSMECNCGSALCREVVTGSK
jgi:hypothetical protein